MNNFLSNHRILVCSLAMLLLGATPVYAQEKFSFEDYFSCWQKKGNEFVVNDYHYKFGRRHTKIEFGKFDYEYDMFYFHLPDDFKNEKKISAINFDDLLSKSKSSKEVTTVLLSDIILDELNSCWYVLFKMEGGHTFFGYVKHDFNKNETITEYTIFLD